MEAPTQSLRPYQEEGVRFLQQRESALLADEMGLGKTIQAVVALDHVLDLPTASRALVVAPASLRLNWERELARWAPRKAVRRLDGDATDRLATLQLPIPIIVSSYEQIRADALALPSWVTFDVLILDEAQRIKNPDSNVALACRLVPRTRAWALTGTPLENSPSDLFSILNFLRPGYGRHHGSGREARRLMGPYYLRRQKADVLGELPPVVMQDVPLELEGNQAATYESLWQQRTSLGDDPSEAAMLALVTRLKQACNFDPETQQSVKLDALLLLVENLPSDSKVIVFSQFVGTLRAIGEKLGQFPHELFHGGLSQRERDETLTRFRAATGARALLISYGAGGVGLNIPEASHLFLFDRWWNPAVEDQAISRAHRFGRHGSLHVLRFQVVNTIEDRIAEILAAKRQLFSEYVESAATVTAELRKMLDLNAPPGGQRSPQRQPREEGRCAEGD